jgi:hypothetical protein
MKEQEKLGGFLLQNILHYPTTPSFPCQNIHLSMLF